MAVTLSGVSSGTLSAAGVGSGLDVKSLVSQLMAVEQRPLTLLASQEASFYAKLSGLGSVSSALSTLQTAAKSLVTASVDAFKTTVSDSTVLTASAASNAVAGSYSVAVTALAQQQKLIAAGVADSAAAIGTGTSTTLTIELGTISGGTLTDGIYAGASFAADATKTAVAVTIDSSNNTLEGMRDAINAADAGVTATIINDGSGSPYRLSLTSNDTGAASSLKLTVSGEAAIDALLGYDPQTTQNLAQTQAAQNAAFTVDSVSISSASNTVADAIQGVTLNLAKASPDPSPATSTVTVQRDSSSLTATLSALVNGYNSANKAIAAATAKGAALQGDWAVLGLQHKVRTILGSVQSSGGTYTMLSQLGVSFQKDGSLALDSTKLAAALSANFGDAAAFTSALGTSIESAADALIGTTGPLANKSDGINRSIKDIGSRRSGILRHLDSVQQRYEQQFRALDALMSSMSATSSFLTQQLGNLPNYYNSK
ncbi:MAG: flagellar filament capping protein FliD [Burkholderiales bacterium]